MCNRKQSGKCNQVISPRPLDVGMSATEAVETTFHCAGAGLLADSAAFFSNLILSRPKTCVGLSLDATLTQGGIAITALLPLVRGGYLDWITITGANLYYDALFALNKPLLRAPDDSGDAVEACGGNICIKSSDREDADRILREILSGPDFQQPMSSANMHHLLGRELRVYEKELGVVHPCLLSTAYELGVPLFNPAPIEGPLGSLISDLAFMGNRLSIDSSFDLNEAAAILGNMRRHKIDNALWSFGRGTAAGFSIGVPAHLNRVMGQNEVATAPFLMLFELLSGSLEMTHLSGSCAPLTPVAPSEITEGDSISPVTMTIQTDLSLAIPLLTAYLLDRIPTRPLRKLGLSRSDLVDKLRRDQLDATLKDLQHPSS